MSRPKFTLRELFVLHMQMSKAHFPKAIIDETMQKAWANTALRPANRPKKAAGRDIDTRRARMIEILAEQFPGETDEELISRGRMFVRFEAMMKDIDPSVGDRWTEAFNELLTDRRITRQSLKESISRGRMKLRSG